MKLVNAETLAAALHDRYQSQYGGCDHWEDGVMTGSTPDCEEDAAAILAAIPPDPRPSAMESDMLANCEDEVARLKAPDPRLAALLAAAESYRDSVRQCHHCAIPEHDALRDALAAFEEPV